MDWPNVNGSAFHVERVNDYVAMVADVPRSAGCQSQPVDRSGRSFLFSALSPNRSLLFSQSPREAGLVGWPIVLELLQPPRFALGDGGEGQGQA